MSVALEQRSQLYRKLGRFDEARDDLERARDLLEKGGGASPFDTAYLDLGLGAIRREQDPTAGSLPLLREAVRSFDALGAQEGRIQARLDLARALRRSDDGRDKAVRQLEEAIEIIETARSDLRLASFRATFLGGWQAVYQELVDVAGRASGVAAASTYQGFDASRELVTGGGLGDVRILHFATHGVADAEDPSLAGLVLSLYDAAGRPRDGLLRARDLHGLHLAADLVVLSACRSALGQEVRGEGLVGLADGFFAAGARHLVVSLWDVDDRATAELMVRFYRHLLLDGRRPADALRRVQRELREETGWRSPAYWAAFVAVGDWDVAPH